MVSPTPNKGYTYPAHGGAVNAWDTPLNTDFDTIDLNVGGPYALTISSTTAAATYGSTSATLPSTAPAATLPTANAANLYYKYTGTMTNDQDIQFPASGGFYIINNGSSGAFTLRAVVAGSTAVNAPIPQGGTSIVATDGSAMVLANSNVLAKIQTFLGNPNSNVAGTAATANGGGTDFEWDSTNKNLYAATTTGSTATTVWTPVAAKLMAQGYLSISTDTSNPILTADRLASTSLQYLPFRGNWMLLSDGTTVYPYQFNPLPMTLTGSQAANGIYDVFATWNAGTPVIGVGPVWSTVTPGSGVRGTGAGTTQISRLMGVWVNTVTMNLTYNIGAGNVVISVPTQQGVYLGSIFIDTVAGQLSATVSYGQNRKWPIFNAGNREPICLQLGDSTVTWTYSTATIRQSNGSANNTATLFCGLPEEICYIQAGQRISSGSGAALSGSSLGPGINTTTAFSGRVPTGSNAGVNQIIQSDCVLAPTLGLNSINFLELGTGTASLAWSGGNADMLMTIKWQG